MSDRGSGETMLAFLLGSIVGASLGMLFAPRAGKEVREKLKVLLEELSERAEDLLEESKDIVQETKGKVSSQKEQTKSKKEY